jgi:hypothetical protein
MAEGPFHYGWGKIRNCGRTNSAGATDLTLGKDGCPNAIMIETAGSVTITRAEDGQAATFAALAVGVWHAMPHFKAITALPGFCCYAVIE